MNLAIYHLFGPQIYGKHVENLLLLLLFLQQNSNEAVTETVLDHNNISNSC